VFITAPSGRLHPAHRFHDAEQQALLALDDLVGFNY